MDESFLETYVTDGPGILDDCYASFLLNDSHADLPGVAIQRYEVCEKVEHGRVAVSSFKSIRCVKDCWYVYCDNVQI